MKKPIDVERVRALKEALARQEKQTAREYQGADRDWLARGLEIVRRLAVSAGEGSLFTSDDIWARIPQGTASTREPRMLGAIMRAAQFRKIADPTAEYQRSTRPECHGRPVRVWKGRPKIMWVGP